MYASLMSVLRKSIRSLMLRNSSQYHRLIRPLNTLRTSSKLKTKTLRSSKPNLKLRNSRLKALARSQMRKTKVNPRKRKRTKRKLFHSRICKL